MSKRTLDLEKVHYARVGRKAAGTLTSTEGALGEVVAYVSVFDNVDSWGDVVVQGAFADAVKAIADGSKVVPVVWHHQTRSPDDFIGEVTSAVEDETGLLATMQFDDPAGKAFKLVANGRVAEWSFAYRVLEGKWIDTEDAFYFELTKVDLLEVSPVLAGANDQTHTVSVKSGSVKAGRTVSAATQAELDRISEAAQSILDTVAALTPEPKSAEPRVADSGAAETVEGETSDSKAASVSVTPDEAKAWASALATTIERNT